MNFFKGLILFAVFCFAHTQTCEKGRLTQYTIYIKQNIPQGTCNFGPVYNEMPLEFKSGRIIAANQDYYNGFKTNLNFKESCQPKNGISCGLRCGQCVMVTGPKGSESFIVADIGDYPNVGIEDAGDMTQFALNNKPNYSLLAVADQPGYEYMTFSPIPCSTNGNVGFFFPESGSNKWSVALTFYNYKVQIKKIEIRGAGPNVRSPNNFIELPRDWTNKYLWRGVEGYLNQKGDIYNGGNAFQLRITSIFDEVIIPGNNFSIPTANISTTLFNLSFQFTKNQFNQTKKCKWTGPYPRVYDDKVISRKYNWTKKDYDICKVGSSGCRTYFEGSFLVEWWLVYQVNLGALNLEYRGMECNSKICIEVTNVTSWGILILGHSSNFDKNSYSNFSFAGKLAQNSNLTTNKLSITFDGCKKTVDFILTKAWTKYSNSISNLECPNYIKNLKFIFSGVDMIYLDDIELENANLDLNDPSLIF